MTKIQPSFHILNSNKLNHQQYNRSLLSRSNQDGISKSNNDPQLGTVVHDKNTKEHPKKIIQKDLLQLITNISATSLKLKQNSKQSVLDKQKNKECKGRSHSIYSQPRPSLK